MSTHPAEQAMPTAERPESGTIGSAGVPLFKVEHWLEDGDHVFRSIEFDMTIGAPDIGAAADRFIESAYDLWGFMEEQQNLTEGELQLASLLASRFRLLLAELERRERARRRRLIAISIPRRGHLGTWRAADQTLDSSSHLSHA